MMRSTEERGAASARTARRSAPPASFCARPAAVLARELLGAKLRSTVGGRVVSGRVVETEAYLGLDDPASHAARRIGRTARNESMFGAAGTAYVYLIYGMHWCLNVVAAVEDDPQAVLVRAVEPIEGRDAMTERRGRARDLTNGPGRLSRAFGIDGSLDGHDLSRAPLELLPAEPVPAAEIRSSGRVGIREARDWALRFYLDESPHLSRGPHLRTALRDPLAPWTG